ncbi:uncharacterized protein TM35_000044990 [Trypanosoma theileri]|uniref:Uncharacterized protein n=1 Tax=Trypanosoma theileri TaxID=67003 RepID=A0A1X0P5Y1_9TRYP|nr:uncharacterized protein TM35_000044990 [Trypanosoma theileri]ORC92285.1 hypothetical protein TM35_000044990 [Trypanosoma theileri]
MKNNRSELRFHPLVITTVVVGVILCFALGYNHGAGAWERQFMAVYNQQQGRERHLSTMYEACHSELLTLSGSVSTNNNTLHAELSENTDMEEQIRTLSQTFEGLTKEHAKCQTEVAGLIQDTSADDIQPGAAGTETEKDLHSLRQSLHNLTEGAGMHTAALLDSLRVLMDVYKELCSSLPGCTLLTDESLIQQWREMMNSVHLIRQEKEETDMKRMLWQYDANDLTHKNTVFLPKDEEKEVPTFFERSGNPLVVLGKEQEPRIVVATTLQRIHALQQAAFCAYNRRDPNVTVSFAFLWKVNDISGISALHDLVQTPLVTFCMDCVGVENSTEFWQQCRDATGDDEFYGKRNFWAARSMVRPHPAVVQEAKNYTKFVLKDKKVLAVVAHNSVNDCIERIHEPRGNHFLYLLANFPQEKKQFETHVSNDTIFQCAPTPTQIVQRITEIMENVKQDGKGGEEFDVVYISVPVEMMHDLRALEVKPKWWEKTIFRVEVESAHEELLDLTVAGLADTILVSPYLAPSQYVVESFLLKNGLRPDGRIWFF